MSSSDEEEEDEREPTLKYSKLTSSLGSIYRGGDSSSSFHVTGDKLIIGTHNGNIHTFSLPSLQLLRSYHGHTSSITAISVSPSSQSLQTSGLDASARPPTAIHTPKRDPTAAHKSPKTPYRPLPPATPSNSIHIATASIDGHVCVSSLVDDKDVTLRNYARPIHAVALSPAFKSDRIYLSGGTAGDLILTTGGKVGVSSDANTNSASAAAAGWLGSIGLGSNIGRDNILHSGEGTITAISWSNSGRYVAWNNEFGTRIMHSHLEGADSDTAWKRIGHVPRPNRQIWEEMAGVWKAKTQWMNTKFLEVDHHGDGHESLAKTEAIPSATSTPARNGGSGHAATPSKKRIERLLVGWGDTVWVVHIISGFPNPNRPTPPAKAEIVHQFRFDDCIISGLTLYTPTKLAALVFRTTDDEENPIQVTENGNRKRGRYNSLPPDLRLIDLASADKDELETESVVVSRFERLSFADYHLSSIYIQPPPLPIGIQRGTLEALGGGLRDMSMSATRLFGSGASVLSGSSGDKTTSVTNSVRSPGRDAPKEVPPALSNSGLKIFIQSPFDCIVAIKRDLADRLSWLMLRQDYEEAWELINDHPEIVTSTISEESRPSTPSRGGHSLADFFDDASSSRSTIGGNLASAQHEQHRIGDLWINKLVASNEWAMAGAVAGKTLGNSPKWEDWIMNFARAEKFDEITPYIPTDHIKAALPSHVYEIILAHYITHDRLQLQDLLDRWNTALFDVSSVLKHIEDYLETGAVRSDTVEDGIRGRDWKILLESLARLYLADARPADAINCYIRTKNADAALEVVREFAKIDAIVDKVYAFVLLRIAPEKLGQFSIQELDELSSEQITMLATASIQGTIDPSDVVAQLQSKLPQAKQFLFFYFRGLWKPEGLHGANTQLLTHLVARSRFGQADAAETPSRMLLAPYADLVVSVFADYSQALLGDFLRTSKDYTFEHASDECRRRQYIPELVYLLSATGQTKSALHLIIDELGDVAMAISFAKEVDEESLWGDLLDYGTDKPEFIRGLLEDVGTSIDPVKLVRRIPEGLHVDGLKGSLARLLRESEITWSISNGASKVLQGEITTVMDELRQRRERGIVFDVDQHGKCETCLVKYHGPESEEHLIGFFCGHIFHLSCLLDEIEHGNNRQSLEKLRRDLDGVEESEESKRGRVGVKIKHAQMIKSVLENIPCLVCRKAAESGMKKD